MTPSDTIRDMVLALSWLRFIDDIRAVRRELSCAGFNEDDIDHYAECAVEYVKQQRALSSGINQMIAENIHED